MIEVQIGTIKKKLGDASPRWINEQINCRRRDGEPVCVQVFIDKTEVYMKLTTPDCPSTAGVRSATPLEQEIFELWERHNLDSSDFTGGNLTAFLKQVAR